MRAGKERQRTAPRGRRGLTMVTSIAAAVLCIGGFGAVVAGSGPGDSLYGLRTALFGEKVSVRDDRVALAAQTEMSQVKEMINHGDWEQAQQKLKAVSTQVQSVDDVTTKTDLINQWNELSVKVGTRDAKASLPASTPGVPAAPPPPGVTLLEVPARRHSDDHRCRLHPDLVDPHRSQQRRRPPPRRPRRPPRPGPATTSPDYLRAPTTTTVASGRLRRSDLGTAPVTTTLRRPAATTTSAPSATTTSARPPRPARPRPAAPAVTTTDDIGRRPGATSDAAVPTTTSARHRAGTASTLRRPIRRQPRRRPPTTTQASLPARESANPGAPSAVASPRRRTASLRSLQRRRPPRIRAW